MFTQRSNQLGPKPRDREDNVTVPSTASKPLVDGSPLSLFVATFPRATEYTEFDEALKNMDKAVQNSTILHCMLHNASYQASITFVDGEQTVHVTDQTVLNPIVYTIGVINHDNEKLDVSVTLSYTEKPNTNIISTTLMETEEMRFIDSLTSPESDNPFPKYWREQSVSSSNHSSPPLSKALEDLFRNITLSLMSSNIFQPNYTVKAVPETNVTITSYHSIYIYNRPILWAAYGTARGATALSSIAGVLVYFSNGGSYGTKFSTVFRVTQGAKVSTNLSMKDYSGFDPLPDHIAKAKMTLGYNPDYPVRVSSTAPLDQPHQRPTDSSQLLDTTTGDSNKSSGP